MNELTLWAGKMQAESLLLRALVDGEGSPRWRWDVRRLLFPDSATWVGQLERP